MFVCVHDPAWYVIWIKRDKTANTTDIAIMKINKNHYTLVRHHSGYKIKNMAVT